MGSASTLTAASIAEMRAVALTEIAVAAPGEIEALRVAWLGRKGKVRQASTLLGQADAADRPELGRLLNEARTAIEQAFAGRSAAAPVVRPRASYDFSLPGVPLVQGRLHLLTQTIASIQDTLVRMGFEVAVGPEVELDYYNFEALNIPADHPARDSFDTFFIGGDVLMRSQTSTVQVRVMEKRRPPIRIIAPGRVYRPDTVDATHSFLFHQVEGLAVDEGITMADLKYVLHEFCRSYFGADTRIRFRQGFFPFTEPSVEVDVSCIFCGGSGCSICKRAGWIEILGAGMVDPNVLSHVGYDTEKYTGFAFGMGVERLAMLRHRIDDIRLFMEDDVRFLRQF